MNRSKGSVAELMIGCAALFWNRASMQSLYFGLFCYIAGILLLMWVITYTQKPEKLDELYGPWKWMRHPELAARFLANVSPLIAARNPFLFIVCLLPLVLTYKRRKDFVEEKMERIFDVDFGSYRLEVPAFYPTLLSIVDPPGRSGRDFMSIERFRKECSTLAASPLGWVIVFQGGILLVMYLKNFVI